MLHGSHHPGAAGSELTRLLAALAALADLPQPAARPAFAERLGHWLSWTGAIALSAALNTPVAAPRAAGRSARSGAANADEADFQRVRAGLVAEITAGPRDGAPSPTDFAPYRHHCLTLQQKMHDRIGALRQRLRNAMLARRAPALARLAAIDAVMDQTLAAQERGLLGLVPLRLQAHFERLRQAALVVSTATPPNARTDEAAWMHRFHDDMAQLLLAELAHRLLPAQGLLDSLGAAHDPTTTPIT